MLDVNTFSDIVVDGVSYNSNLKKSDLSYVVVVQDSTDINVDIKSKFADAEIEVEKITPEKVYAYKITVNRKGYQEKVIYSFRFLVASSL